jgi:hypothetical protein
MQQFGGKDSKRHFTVVMGGKEHGLYVSSTPSSAARKAVTKLCAANKSKKVQFEIREITQGSKKKTYGPYDGYIEKLKEPIELKGRVIKYKPVAKLSGKSGMKKGGMRGGHKFKIYTVGTEQDGYRDNPGIIIEDDEYDWWNKEKLYKKYFFPNANKESVKNIFKKYAKRDLEKNKEEFVVDDESENIDNIYRDLKKKSGHLFKIYYVEPDKNGKNEGIIYEDIRNNRKYFILKGKYEIKKILGIYKFATDLELEEEELKREPEKSKGFIVPDIYYELVINTLARSANKVPK